jgi:hypothetical protein
MIPDHFTIQFGRNFNTAVQQIQSRFRGAAVVETGCTGEAKTHNLVLPLDDEEVTGERFAKTVLRELDTEKRWIRPRMFDNATGEPKWDEELLAPTILPGGKHIELHSAAYARRTDKVFISGLLGVNFKGKDGTEAANIPAENVVPVDYNPTGSPTDAALTIDKITRAKGVLTANEAFGDDARARGIQLWGAMSPQMEEFILYQVNNGTGNRLASSDFYKPIVDDNGNIRMWLGINWIRSTNLPFVEGTPDIREAAVWTSDACHLDFWGEITSTVDRRPDLKNAVQFFSQYSMNAVRSEDKKVVKINCVEV